MTISKEEYLKIIAKNKQKKTNKFNIAPKEDRFWYGKYRGRFQKILFDSRGEKERFTILLLLEHRGEISGLQIKERFPLGVNTRYYESDFSYFRLDKFIVEDYKGVETSVFKLKWEMVKSLYPEIDFLIVR